MLSKYWQKLPVIWQRIIPITVGILAVISCYKPKLGFLLSLSIVQSEVAMGFWRAWGFPTVAIITIPALLSDAFVGTVHLTTPAFSRKWLTSPWLRPFLLLAITARRHPSLLVLLCLVVFVLAATPAIPLLIWVGVLLAKIASLNRWLSFGIILSGNTLKHVAWGKILDLLHRFNGARTPLIACGIVALVALVFFFWEHHSQITKVEPCETVGL